MTRCTTCGCPAAAPYRVFDAHGMVVQGCIDAAHDGQLEHGTESARWHYRPAAMKHRTNVRVRLAQLFHGEVGQ